MNLDDLRYPPLAASARIQGDVAIEVSAAGQQPISGHPLLARAVLANLGTWILPPLEGGKYQINYNFKFIDPSMKWETVLIGNKLDRFFWRLVKAPTKKTIRSCY